MTPEEIKGARSAQIQEFKDSIYAASNESQLHKLIEKLWEDAFTLGTAFGKYAMKVDIESEKKIERSQTVVENEKEES